MNYLISNKLITLKEQIDVLKIKFKELKMLSYPDSNNEVVIDFMDNIANKIDTRLAYFKNNGISNEELGLMSALIQIFYERVGCVANCDARNHPREIMIPIKELLSFTNKQHIFITEPQWELNYSVGKLLNEQYIDALKVCGVILDSDIDVIKLAFPKLHQDDILGGAIMSHELGHYIDLHYSLDLSEKIIVKLMSSINIDKYMKYIYISIPESVVKPDEIRTILKSKIPDLILRNWVKEVVADILGVIFYGVASYLSAENLSIYYTGINNTQTQFVQQFATTHPRDGLRNYIRFITLSQLGYLDVCDKILINKLDEYSKQWKESITGPFKSINYNINDIAYFVINNNYLLSLENDIKSNIVWIIDLIINDIRTVSSDLIYSCDKYADEVPSLIEKIKNIIPPNEIGGVPANSISIINAGWVAYILHFDNIKASLNSNELNGSSIDVKKVINNLIKKATLASSIHRRWINVINK